MSATEKPRPSRSARSSALRNSALGRLAFAAVPMAVLWGAVAFALDLFA